MMNEIYEFDITKRDYRLCSLKEAEDKLAEALSQKDVLHEASWVRITDVDESYFNLITLGRKAYFIVRMYKPEPKPKKSRMSRIWNLLKTIYKG